MNAKERREQILHTLCDSTEGDPINATVLAKRFGVSRQVIVGDVAILRTAGEPILATSRGYCYRTREPIDGACHRIVCNHTAEEMEEELNAIVDHGGQVVNVTVDHPIYGALTGDLHLHCRYDVEHFCKQIKQAGTRPLSILTEGIHTHQVCFSDETAYARLVDTLRAKGILLSCD